MRNRLARLINRAWFGLGLPEIIWPNPDTTPAPISDRVLAVAALDALIAVGKVL